MISKNTATTIQETELVAIRGPWIHTIKIAESEGFIGDAIERRAVQLMRDSIVRQNRREWSRNARRVNKFATSQM